MTAEEFLRSYFEHEEDYLAFKLSYSFERSEIVHIKPKKKRGSRLTVKNASNQAVSVGDRPGHISYFSDVDLLVLEWFNPAGSGEVSESEHVCYQYLAGPLYWNPVDGFYYQAPGDYTPQPDDDVPSPLLTIIVKPRKKKAP